MENFEQKLKPEEKNFVRENDAEAQKKIKEKIDMDALSEKLLHGGPFEPWRGSKKIIEALARLTYELKDNIADYDTIISDEGSGHLASSLFKKMINEQREKQGKENANCYFLSLYSHEHYLLGDYEDRLKKFLKDRKDKLGKVLVVTEWVCVGLTFRNLVKVFKDVGIEDYTLAAVSADCDKEEYSPEIKERLKYGALGGDGAFMRDSERFSGVRKKKDFDKYDVADGELPIHPERVRDAKSVDLSRARQDIDILAKELSKLLE